MIVECPLLKNDIKLIQKSAAIHVHFMPKGLHSE